MKKNESQFLLSSCIHQKLKHLHMSKLSSPKISVLIPVYNVEKYLHKCLDSVIHQTLQEIEIICVDDGSTDNSGDICDEYAQRDSRITVIHKSHNEGLLLARKTAVIQASGDYIFFLDSDDYLTTKNSLSIVLEEMLKDPVDILKFSAEVVDFSRLSEKYLWNNGSLACENMEIQGGVNINSMAFLQTKSWNLWNKLYCKEVCVQAYKNIKNVHLIMAEDVYTYFIITFFANTYRSIKCQPIYAYRLGSGISTSKDLPLSKYHQFLRMKEIPIWLEEFIHNHPHHQLLLSEAINFLNSYLYSVIVQSLLRLSPTEICLGLDLLLSSYASRKDAVYKLAKELYQILQDDCESIPHIQKLLAGCLSDNYRNIALYDKSIEKQLPQNINIIPLPKLELIPNSQQRTESSADTIILPCKEASDLLFEIILLRLHKKYLLITEKINEQFTGSKKILFLANKVIVQNLCKQHYYQDLGVNAVFIPPPIIPLPQNTKHTAIRTNEIVWLGVFDTIQQHGVEFMHIIPAVLKFSPQCKFIVESFNEQSPELHQKTLAFINTHQLAEHIVWLTPDNMLSHVQSAHVLLVTKHPTLYSEAILSAKVAGTPTIIGVESFVDNFIDWHGSIAFPSENVNQLVIAIHSLTMNPIYWDTLSKEASSFIAEYYNNPEQHWNNLLTQLPHTEHSYTDNTYHRSHAIFWDNMQQLCSQKTDASSTMAATKNFQVSLYLKYKILSKITWGNRKKHYQQLFDEQLKLYDLIRNPR